MNSLEVYRLPGLYNLITGNLLPVYMRRGTWTGVAIINRPLTNERVSVSNYNLVHFFMLTFGINYWFTWRVSFIYYVVHILVPRIVYKNNRETILKPNIRTCIAELSIGMSNIHQYSFFNRYEFVHVPTPIYIIIARAKHSIIYRYFPSPYHRAHTKF